MPTALGAAFTATVRMIERIHRRAANVRPASEPTATACFAPYDCHAVRITGCTDRRATSRWNATDFAAGQRNLRPTRFAGHERRACPCTAAKCATTSGLNLNIVNRRAEWDLRQWQAIADGRR